jgi:outer membrane lipopolysaccharide assembly protein LptE/RlpB
MKKSLMILLIATLVLLTAIGWTRKGEASAKETWEYKIVNVGISKASDPAPEQAINLLGDEGWELVQANTTNGSFFGVYVFKRPK